MKYLSYLIFGSAILMTILGCADKNEYVLNFAMIDTKPYFYQENGEYKGECINYMDRICAKAGCKYDPKIYTIDTLLSSLQSGEVDISFLPVGTAVEVNSDIANQGTSRLDVGLYYPQSQSEQSLADLSGKRIAVVKDYTYSGVLLVLRGRYPRMKVEVVDSQTETFELLKQSKVDAVLAYKEMSEAAKLQLDSLNYKSLHHENIYLVLSKNSKHPNPEELLKALNQANDEVVKEDKSQ